MDNFLAFYTALLQNTASFLSSPPVLWVVALCCFVPLVSLLRRLLGL